MKGKKTVEQESILQVLQIWNVFDLLKIYLKWNVLKIHLHMYISSTLQIILLGA